MRRSRDTAECVCGAEVKLDKQFDHWLRCTATVLVKNSEQDARYGRRRTKAKNGKGVKGGALVLK